MEQEKQNINAVYCPPCGESTLKGGKGVVNKEVLFDNPPSALRATSPAGGEVNDSFTLIEQVGQALPDNAPAKGHLAAFTIIELLVVVLIIGILAAVAVPQYQKAVERSHAAQALSLLNAAYKYAGAYYLANGTYPTTFDEMGMDVPWPVTTRNSLKWVNMAGLTKETRSDGTWSLQLYHTEMKGNLIIFVGLVSGKYAGAGFQISLSEPKNITCVERKKNGVIFNQNPGDYCEKMMNGTLVTGGTNDTYRMYNLP